MKLEEAIKHLEETLNNPNHEWSCAECKAEHEQLLMWLKDYKRLLEMPKGDLISREALREDLRRFFPTEVLEGIEPKTLFAQIMHDIDNAPTVEPDITEKQAILTIINSGWLVKHDKELREKYERPQGKWIYPEKTDKEKGYGGYCSNCKCDMPIFIEDWKQKYCETKFCPNCGADMRGEKK